MTSSGRVVVVVAAGAPAMCDSVGEDMSLLRRGSGELWGGVADGWGDMEEGWGEMLAGWGETEDG